MSELESTELWVQSANAWIEGQGDEGDWSRRNILDPALEPFLSSVAGKRVLDLGCGEGRYARKMRDAGAQVTGIDPVPRFIERARELDLGGRYEIGFAESLPFDDASFDFVLSYLTIIDFPDLDAATSEMVRVTAPGGQIVIVTISNLASTTEGWVKDAEGNRAYRTVDRYMEHFSMVLEWKDLKIRNYHRPLSDVLGGFLRRGCVLTDFQEPLPSPDHPGYLDERRVPTFQIMTLRREG